MKNIAKKEIKTRSSRKIKSIKQIQRDKNKKVGSHE